MARAKLDPQILAHLEWIGFVRPTGLVVSAPALVRAGAILDRRDTEGQRLLRACVEEREFDPKEGPVAHVSDFRTFAESVLGWSFSPRGYAGTSDSPIPPELEVPLPDYGETLRPDFAAREPDSQDDAVPWQLLVRVLKPGQDFDRVVREGGQLEASAHGRMERLLRRTGVSAGLLFNGRALRLVSAPSGESSGWLDFHVADMVQTAGRPISTAMRLLLSQQRLLALPKHQRLAALLDDSRKFQNEVSERLAEQVLHALYELLRGFQAAHDASKGELLREVLAEHPDEVYRALLTVILRLVFVLYAEERDMLPEDETFLRYYSLAGLYERLREDAALFPDTMDQRYGAWAQLLVLFRMVYDGAESDGMRLPRRHGVLFDPDRFPFLEGRTLGDTHENDERMEAPLVPDGTIYRSLEKLLVLDGERISYRALDVEQIGSVYETMMGFRLETATGRSVAIKAPKKHGAPTAVDLEALLAESGSSRDKWLRDRTDRKLTAKVKKAAKGSETLEDLHAALLPVIDLAASPDLVPKGAMVLQPSEERRRSGSHYTPRSLTEPIVRTTLEPILARLRGEDGRPPRPEQILDLKVCDPAMGSGAFLVEACRQLGDSLVESWRAHDAVPEIPRDEDEVIFARRLVAQRCLYGVDKNPVAVDLSKMSLWLVTLAKDHALTFVDHALRHGDSLVGLSRKQIEAFHWDPDAPRFQAGFETMQVRGHVARVAELRERIREADESVSDWELRDLWNETEAELIKVRLFGDLVLAAFFEGEKAKEREAKRNEYANAIVGRCGADHSGRIRELRQRGESVLPFHWELEFPEVFGRDRSGFDVFVGNPPFLGGTKIGGQLGLVYHEFLMTAYRPATGLVDLVAFFLRRCFALLRSGGTFGLIATNTIAQGDTRETALQNILEHGGSIYSAIRRKVWPGTAAVVTTVIHAAKQASVGNAQLDGQPVQRISAFLVAGSVDTPPCELQRNKGICYEGAKPWGSGFIFEPSPSRGSSSIEDMERLLANDPSIAEVIFPYMGGQEFNASPTQSPERYIIDLARMSESQARQWPSLFELLAALVKPVRAGNKQRNYREEWWLHANRAPEIGLYAREHGRVLALTAVSRFPSFAFVPPGIVVSNSIYAFLLHTSADFAVLQSQCHELWARFSSSSMGDALRYTTVCFTSFPRPESQAGIGFEAPGNAYYELRASLMLQNDEGLTKTYNRFHDPDERDPEIEKLREVHAIMDRAVLDAYGWSDIPTDCEFLLDYEIDEEEWGGKKKPYSYRWPDDVRDEVLARLLKLNAERAREEALSGTALTKKRGKRAATKRELKTTETRDLFDDHAD